MTQTPTSARRTQPPSSTGALDHWASDLNSIGWFIPPFVQMGTIGRLAAAAGAPGGGYSQADLERDLEAIYSPLHLATMATCRYPVANGLRDYSATIEEAIEAHVLGLDHVAVAGLIPVIEGAARKLAALHGVPDGRLKPTIRGLTNACKADATARNLGAVGEVHSMLDSFAGFAEGFLYRDSKQYPLPDNTNRHGILHGAFADADYGRPLNFLKTIAAIDFLTFVSTFIGGGSWMAPQITPRACFLAANWMEQRVRRDQRQQRATPASILTQLEEIRHGRQWLQTLPIDDPVPP